MFPELLGTLQGDESDFSLSAIVPKLHAAYELWGSGSSRLRVTGWEVAAYLMDSGTGAEGGGNSPTEYATIGLREADGRPTGFLAPFFSDVDITWRVREPPSKGANVLAGGG